MTLAHFLSQSVKKALLVFQCLRKNKRFQWMDKCEVAFQELKVMMASPSVLMKLVKCMSILVYLSISNKAINIAIVQEGVKTRYQKIEKETLALEAITIFSKQLVVVRTGLPIKQVLRKPDLTGRIVGWTVELLEFDISFKRNGHIKAQVLANFIMKLAPTREVSDFSKEWTLSVDEASNQKGSGAGVILKDPNGVMIEQSLHFEFKLGKVQGITNQDEASQRIGSLGSLVNKILGQSTKSGSGVQKIYIAASSKLVVQASKYSKEWEVEVCCAANTTTWMDPIVDYLQKDEVPGNPKETKKLKREALKYLYRRGFSYPLLRFLDLKEEKYAMKEVQEGVCGIHIGGRALSNKIVRVRYYWPILKRDYTKFVKRCDKCQQFANLHKEPPKLLYSATSPWPFHMWGVDILGPFPLVVRQVKFLIVVVDYFTKKVERKSIARILIEQIKRFYRKKKSHTNNQAESANKIVHRVLRRRLEEAKERLTFGIDVVIPIEIGEPCLITTFSQLAQNEEEIRANLDLLQEVWEVAHTKEYATKRKARLGPERILNDGTSNKLTPNWEGPYKIVGEVNGSLTG
ncbi:hypothetical protein CR513_24937, partial [Mucuna pruriens]